MLKENWPYREEAFLTKRPYETGDILIFINTLKCCGVGYQSTKYCIMLAAKYMLWESLCAFSDYLYLFVIG